MSFRTGEIVSITERKIRLRLLSAILGTVLNEIMLISGRIYSGMSVVKRIGLVETDKNDRPVDDVKILKTHVRNTL
jgi:hypothetical protein